MGAIRRPLARTPRRARPRARRVSSGGTVSGSAPSASRVLRIADATASGGSGPWGLRLTLRQDHHGAGHRLPPRAAQTHPEPGRPWTARPLRFLAQCQASPGTKTSSISWDQTRRRCTVERSTFFLIVRCRGRNEHSILCDCSQCLGQLGHARRALERTPPHVVQRIARHADLDVTLGIYAHTDFDAKREAFDSIEWKDL